MPLVAATVAEEDYSKNSHYCCLYHTNAQSHNILGSLDPANSEAELFLRVLFLKCLKLNKRNTSPILTNPFTTLHEQ